MIGLLPKWRHPDSSPAFYDTESVTAIEGVAKMGVKINELIEDYNKFVDEWNQKITEFEYSTNEELELFERSMRQEFQDFINSLDIRFNILQSELEELKVSFEGFIESNANGENQILEEIEKMKEDMKALLENNVTIEEMKKRIRILEGANFNYVDHEVYNTSGVNIPSNSSDYIILNDTYGTHYGLIRSLKLSNNLFVDDDYYSLNRESLNFEMTNLKPNTEYYIKFIGNFDVYYWDGFENYYDTNYMHNYEQEKIFVFNSGLGGIKYISLRSEYGQNGEGIETMGGFITGIFLCENSDPNKEYSKFGSKEIIEAIELNSEIVNSQSKFSENHINFNTKELTTMDGEYKDISSFVDYDEYFFIKVAPGGLIEFCRDFNGLDDPLANTLEMATVSYTYIEKT